MKPSWPRQLRALLLKDLRLELRTRDTIAAMILFAVAAMVIFQFGFGTRDTDLTRFAGGLLWVTIALTAVLGVGRTYVAEREQRVLDGLLAAPGAPPGADGGQGAGHHGLPAGGRGDRRAARRHLLHQGRPVGRATCR